MKTIKRFVSTVTPALLLLSPLAAHAGDLVVAAFGGLWEQSFRQCVIKPYEQQTGKHVDVVLGTPAQWLNQIGANPSKPPIDVIATPADNAIDATKRGLVMKLDAGHVPRIKEIPARFVDPVDGYGAVFDYGAMGALYNRKTVPNPPTDWKSFVQGTIAGKWHASMPSINYFGGGISTLWMYSSLYGGNLQNIQPALDQIKQMVASGHLDMWTDPNQVLNALKSGDVDIAMYWDGRAWAFINGGNKEFNYYTPSPGATISMTFLQKVKGGSDLAWDFINLAMSPGPQACFAAATRYGVTNQNVVYPADVKPQITQIDKLIFPPFKDFPQYQSSWVDQWNKQVGR
ncbi:extracellular solute-binding protein [Burkholderia sp. Ac-20365]|uniref:extracellular solute-binding protein n=1 Tax=Burkholderia sp. Ac-20365 TaxID=2703897 RepID=UPI00197C6D1C|nr:extracellular solute-binding protein [Burkholderia sp. Ac-20365]MBN3766182.1 extracellular solute-binding protein [Burkholderia sp. Ac-20365]